MIDRDQAERLLEDGGHLFLASGDDHGPLLRAYLDEYTGWPSFCTVASDQPDREILVALHEAELRPGGHGITVPYDADKISHAPTVKVEEDLTISEEDALFEYYEVPLEGDEPSVEHLGSVLVPADHDDADHSAGAVVEHDAEHPSS